MIVDTRTGEIFERNRVRRSFPKRPTYKRRPSTQLKQDMTIACAMVAVAAGIFIGRI